MISALGLTSWYLWGGFYSLVCFVDQVSFKHPKTTILEKSVSYRQDWDDLVSKAEEGPNCQSANFPCISTALKWATHDREPFCCDVTATVQVETGDLDHVQVLVTGSLILVGDVLGIIYPTLNDWHWYRNYGKACVPQWVDGRPEGR